MAYKVAFGLDEEGTNAIGPFETIEEAIQAAKNSLATREDFCSSIYRDNWEFVGSVDKISETGEVGEFETA